MPRNKKKLTAQDAFIGVRRPDPEPVEPPPADATPPATPDPAPESPKPAPSKRRRSPQSGKTNLNPDAELAAALAEAQAVLEGAHDCLILLRVALADVLAINT